MTRLKTYLQTKFSFTDEESDQFLACFTSKKFKKEDYFLKEGQHCKSIAFVEKGSFIYYETIDGEEKVCDFAFEESWITHYQSLLYNTPSEINIAASEHADILVMDLEKIEALTATLPKISLLRATMAEQHFTESAKRASQLANLKADEMYVILLEEKPEINQRIPQYQIASYLGIKPQSLSRIRSKLRTGK